MLRTITLNGRTVCGGQARALTRQGDQGRWPIANSRCEPATGTAIRNVVHRYTNHPRGVRLAYIRNITYKGWPTEAVGSRHARHRGPGGNREDRWGVVVSGAGSIHVNRLNSYNESLLVYFTGDEACILLHN